MCLAEEAGLLFACKSATMCGRCWCSALNIKGDLTEPQNRNSATLTAGITKRSFERLFVRHVFVVVRYFPRNVFRDSRLNKQQICRRLWLQGSCEVSVFIVSSSGQCLEPKRGEDLYLETEIISASASLFQASQWFNVSPCHSNWVMSNQTLDYIIFVVGIQNEIWQPKDKPVCFDFYLSHLFQRSSEHAVLLYFCIKILVAACVSQFQCPVLTQWVSKLYNFAVFTGDVCSAMLRVISAGESNLP